MKVKEISRTANVAWSPSGLQSIYLACGTVAQQLDATFSTSAKLELFALDLTQPGLTLPLVASVESPLRFHKLAWSSHGAEGTSASGIIAGGSDNGTITLWTADKIFSGSEDSQVHQNSQHTGPVRTLDFNPFQPNLLASGASESEIFIWDLNNPGNAMSPGNKIHPLEDISGIAWNRQVQHILASTSPSGRSIVWDLRKNEPIIQVADTSARVHCNAIAWHPEVATQMVTASGDDRSPVVQLWDLRFATSPMRTLERHKKGILSLAWCPQDPDLLLSAAKDNLVLCWNPNSDVPGGEVVYELPATTQWIFECHWCPRNPAIISTASFDGHVTMYSLLGGEGHVQEEAEPIKTPPPSDDIFSILVKQQPVETAPLKRPPKWFRRPCAARFAFGGKLVSFADSQSSTSRTVHISQVVTEQQLLEQSSTLEQALSQQQFSQFCEEKAASSSSTSEQSIWNFLKVTFEPEPRRQYLNLLGYNPDELDKQFSAWRSGSMATGVGGAIDPTDLSQRLSSIPLGDREEGEGEEEEEEEKGGGLFGAGGGDAGGSVFNTLSSERPQAAFQLAPGARIPSSRLTIPTDSDVEGALSKALLVGNFEAAVDICIGTDQMAEAMVLAIAGGPDLLQRTKQAFFQKKETEVTRLISAVVNRDWTHLVRFSNLDNWREVLAALVTYAGPDEFSPLCDLLGERLENEGNGRYHDNANLCYICSGNVDKFVECWNKTAEGSPVSALALQDLVEKVILLRQAVARERRQFAGPSSSILADKFGAYSNLLASQGSLSAALNYLEMSGTSDNNSLLHDRLYQALGGSVSGPKPKFPFQVVDVQSQALAPDQTTTAAPQSEPEAPPTVHQPGPGVGSVSSPYYPGPGGAAVPSYPPSCGLVPPAPPKPQPQPYIPFVPLTRPRISVPPSTATPSTTISQAPMVPTTTAIYNPVPTGPGQATPPPDVSQMPPAAQGDVAWNDPPLLKTKKTSAPVHAPIMAPIMAPVGEPIPSQQVPPTAVPPTAAVSQQQPSPSPVQTQPPIPQPVEKPPVPPEHQPMVSAFESILHMCKAASTTTAMRRKTEDISKKLSILCDLLRESRISPEVLQGLHFISQDASSFNYQAGLARYTQMVSSGSFSEISSFMPGIKALLQLAMQLRV